MRMRMRLFVAVLFAGVVACASLPAKQQAVTAVQTAETALGQAQDVERQLCNPALAARTPPVAITHCEGPTATALRLDDATHQRFAQTLSTAFGLQLQATT